MVSRAAVTDRPLINKRLKGQLRKEHTDDPGRLKPPAGREWGQPTSEALSIGCVLGVWNGDGVWTAPVELVVGSLGSGHIGDREDSPEKGFNEGEGSILYRKEGQ